MKLTDYVIFFVIIALPVTLMTNYKIDSLSLLQQKQILYDRYVDSAVESGITYLQSEVDSTGKLNKDEAVRVLLNSLALNFGLELEENYHRQILLSYIPVIAVIEEDGLSCYSFSQVVESGGVEVRSVWYPKVHFKEELTGYTVFYTLTDHITLINKATGRIHSGKRQDIYHKVSLQELGNADDFDQRRRLVIIRTLEQELEAYVNRHNDYAKMFGITYSFQFPSIEEEEWQNTIDDVSMMLFIQGVPTGIENQVYNSYGLGGAKILKTSGFVMTGKLEDATLTYHRESCDLVREQDKKKELYDSPQHCALKGAYPCSSCKP